MESHSIEAPAVLRRKRKIARQQRDKTPEPTSKGQRPLSDDEEESSGTADQMYQKTQQINHKQRPSNIPILNNTTNKSPKLGKKSSSTSTPAPSPSTKTVVQETSLAMSSNNNAGIQTIRMQIRPPGTMSAHESKILRRRNKAFAGTAARSQSQPRENEINSNPEITDLMRSARRSLSSTRHRDETDESGQSSPQIMEYSPLVEMQKRMASGEAHSADKEKLSKLEKNFKKFEEERKKFEVEKKKFEREKREIHKIRYRHLIEAEERKRMLENYRKNSGDRDYHRLPSDSDDTPKLSQSFREPRRQYTTITTETPTKHRMDPKQRTKHYRDYESSTVSESDSEAVQADIEYEDATPIGFNRGSPPPPPVRQSVSKERKSVSRHDSSTSKERKSVSRHDSSASKERKSVSRHDSMSPIRRRKSSKTTENYRDSLITTEILDTAEVSKPTIQSIEVQKQGFFAKLMGIFKRSSIKNKKEEDSKLIHHNPDEICFNDKVEPAVTKIFSCAFIILLVKEFRAEWKKLKQDYPNEVFQIRCARNKCLGHFILLILLLGFGGLIFRFTEANFENVYKCEVKKVKRDFIDQLWLQSHSMREEDWKSSARTKLRNFEEELYNVHDAGLKSYSGMKAWNFLNSIIYCWTVITQIGYGHIAPQTALGRGFTIVYAIIGIPMFLILLADFGKLFTRCIKFVWAYIRRVYYTGTCRQVRKSQQMQDVMKGVNTVYDAAIRRPSKFIREIDIENANKNEPETPSTTHPETLAETPTSPYPETIEIDDEFNLPISVATVILVLYIISGATVYAMWEDWSYFESFYFVFISMSTIGFGDFVPDHPIFMMCSILYLIFGLALTSMFINVVQIKLSDSFKQASAKIGATIGFTMSEDSESNIVDGRDTALNNISEADEEKHNTDYDENVPPPLLPRQTMEEPNENTKKKTSFFSRK